MSFFYWRVTFELIQIIYENATSTLNVYIKRRLHSDVLHPRHTVSRSFKKMLQISLFRPTFLPKTIKTSS